MSNKRLGVLLSALAAFILAGCTTPPPRELSRELPRYASLPNGHNPLKPEQLIAQSMPADVDAAQGVIPYFERVRGHSLNILEIPVAVRMARSARASSMVGGKAVRAPRLTSSRG